MFVWPALTGRGFIFKGKWFGTTSGRKDSEGQGADRRMRDAIVNDDTRYIAVKSVISTLA